MQLLQQYTPYSARMNPQTTHNLLGSYMEVLILGTILQYMVCASLSRSHIHALALEVPHDKTWPASLKVLSTMSLRCYRRHHAASNSTCSIDYN